VNWLALFAAAAKLIAAIAKFFSDRQLISAGKAAGRAESEAVHARAAAEAEAEMRAIADKPPGRGEIDKRLEGGSA
jgi:hypothetical protein